MFRGDVWDVRFPGPTGYRPAVILTTNGLLPKLSHVTVVEITGTTGPSTTHVSVNGDSGLTGREQSYANTTMIHTVRKSSLRRYRGRLSPGEMRRIEEAVQDYLDIPV